MDRHLKERAFHDRQAQQRGLTVSHELRFPDDAYLDHETWIRPAMDRLGDLQGLHVLDFGCGHGMSSVVLSRRGARVTAFDLSSGYVQEASARALANNVRIDFVQADGERLPFADRIFDRVWGNAILHHLDLRASCFEIARVLKPGGRAVFCEPWGENPVLNLARDCFPYAGKDRTPDERPLRQSDLLVLRRFFSSVETQGFQLLSMVRRLLREQVIISSLDWCDAMLLGRVPRLQRFCRYTVLTLHR